MKTKAWFVFLLGTASIVPMASCQTTRLGYESAPYTVVEVDGAFEIRDYPELVVIETVEMDETDDGGQSFNRLFRFISGHNETGEKIPMTTPVFFTGEGEKRTMAFVLPSALSLAEAPEPRDTSVKLGIQPPGRYAVERYSGARSEKREEKALADIRLWVLSQGHETVGDPVFGYFDPPWTPGFMRRNEVMLRLAGPIENRGTIQERAAGGL